jgi:leader peptidase (prepilin peptidase)/N-methyltransferase
MNYQFVFLVLGLLVGSFLNVVIFRFPKLKGLIAGRSECLHCKKQIATYDLIPVLSYVFLLGRCRNCKKPISIQYPIVEASVGILFMAMYLKFGLTIELIPYLILVCLSVLIFVHDIKYLEIPEIFSWILVFFAVIAAFFVNDFSITNILLGGLVGGGVLGILVGISDEKWMGSGDIKIGLAFGFLLGLERSIIFLFLAFIIGAIIGTVLIIAKGKNGKSEIAFAPFLIIAALLSIFFGQTLVNFYLKFVII